MKKKEKLLIVDGNNLLLRAYFKFKNKGFSNGTISTGAIYGFFKILYSNITRFNISEVVIAFDCHRSKLREEVYPEYKQHRKRISEDWDQIFKVQFPIIKRILRNMGITYIWDNHGINDMEGDDYLALLYQKNCLQEVYLLSSDEDFVQLLEFPNIKIINPSKDMIITSKNCKEVYGYEPKQAKDMKILCGDSSDNILGLKGVGPKTALKFLEEFGSISSFIASGSTQDKKFEKKQLKRVYDRNRLLIDLFYFLTKVDTEKIPYHIKKRSWDSITLNRIFQKYQLKSFNSSEFIKPFKKLKQYGKL